MVSPQRTVQELDSVDWEILQHLVRAFQQTLDRGERPDLDAFVPQRDTLGSFRFSTGQLLGAHGATRPPARPAPPPAIDRLL